jgi:hypothetical protein
MRCTNIETLCMELKIRLRRTAALGDAKRVVTPHDNAGLRSRSTIGQFIHWTDSYVLTSIAESPRCPWFSQLRRPVTTVTSACHSNHGARESDVKRMACPH